MSALQGVLYPPTGNAVIPPGQPDFSGWAGGDLLNFPTSFPGLGVYQRHQPGEIRMKTGMLLGRLGLVACVCVASSKTSEAQSLFRRFLPVDQVESDSQSGYNLTEENGPWLILTTTFSGEGAEEQANELVLEFRQRFNLPAFTYEMTFGQAESPNGRGIDNLGARIKRRYQQEGVRQEWAVLVGNFATVDDAKGQRVLKQIKLMVPETLKKDGEQTSQTMAEVRAWQDKVLARMGAHRHRGPMSKAFMTSNPLLPREYFVPKGVDKFVEQINKGVQHSLLDCEGKYSVKVATFRGNSVLQTATKTENRRGKEKRGGGLVAAAENAHLLTKELRKHDWEAYEFHDRYESIVTIGSFDRPGRQLPDGRVMPTSKIDLIVRRFGAAYDTPSDPLNAVGDDTENRNRREQMLQNFSSSFSNKHAQVTTTLSPKHVKILKRKQLLRTIPMDIKPTVIEVPKRSLSTAYMQR